MKNVKWKIPGPRTLDYGPRTTDHGLRTTDHGPRTTDHGLPMRVIGGIHRGRRLSTVGGLAVRPTSDRLRETLFNILAPRIRESRFLDICAGSGAIGIEALSRGASEATFIERSRPASAVIEANLAALGITSATIIKQDAAASLKTLARESAQFDIVFFDPPYASEIYAEVMTQLGSSSLLTPEGLVIVEHRVKAPLLPESGSLRMFREVKQGESALAFFEEVCSP